MKKFSKKISKSINYRYINFPYNSLNSTKYCHNVLCQANLRQKDAQLEHHVTTVQQLTSQLREREGRLRQREEELQQKDTQIQLKDEEIQKKNADISRLQREKQVGIKNN